MPASLPLTPERIVDAATRVADTAGLAGLSMRSVARELGVEAMSLYHHVGNKDGLLDGMVDAVFAEFHTPVVGAPWEAELRTRSVTARVALKRHPWAVGLMDSRRGAGPVNLGHHDAVLGCLREAGFSWPLAGTAFALLDAHLYGFLVQELSLPFSGPDDVNEVAGELVEAFPEGMFTYMRDFAEARVLAPGYDFGDEFEIGLDLVLEGLRRRHEAEQS